MNAKMSVVVNAAGGLSNGHTYWVNSVTPGTYPNAGTTITVTSNYKSGVAHVITNSVTGLTATMTVGIQTPQGIPSMMVNGMAAPWGNPTKSYQAYPGYNNTLTTITGAELLRINREFLAADAVQWVQNNYGGVVTTTASNGTITTSTPHNLTVGDPVVFSPATLSITATAVSGNNITVSTTSGILAGDLVVFSGNLGNLVQGTTYYVNS